MFSLLKNAFRPKRASDGPKKVCFIGRETAYELKSRFDEQKDEPSLLLDFSAFDPKLRDEELFRETDRELEAFAADVAVVEISSYLPTEELLSKDAALKRADGLRRVLKKHFNKNDIILIHLSDPEFCRVGGYLWDFPETKLPKTYLSLRSAVEARLQRKLGCLRLDTTKFYFYCKRTGYKSERNYYEPECYDDLLSCIDGVISGKSGCGARPDWALSLKRYIMYKPGLQTRPHKIYLDSSDFLDRLVLSANADFVSEFFEELKTLRMLDWSNAQKAVQDLESAEVSDKLKGIIKAFHAASSAKYDEDVPYTLMLKSGVVPERLLKDARQFAVESDGLLPIQVNVYNAGYYFAKMRGLPEADFVTENMTLRPTVVDIFGSCWSRTAFNIIDDDYAVNNYWFHVPPIQGRSPAVTYPPATFVGRLNWTDRLVKKQFDNAIEADMLASDAEWLILDFYSLVAPDIFKYKDLIYGDYGKGISKKLGAEKTYLRSLLTLNNPEDPMRKAFDDWLDKLKGKYGDNIILVNGRRSAFWLGDDGVIYYSGEKPEKGNLYVKRMFEYAKRRLNCYSISKESGFLPDERGYMRRRPSHSQDLYYTELHNTIKHITANRPKKMNYNVCHHVTWIKQLIYLSENNPPEVIKAAVNLDPIDECILSLGHRAIKRNWRTLARLYRFERKDVKRALSKFDFKGNEVLKEKLVEASKWKMIPEPSLPRQDYPRFIKESEPMPFIFSKDDPYKVCFIGRETASELKKAFDEKKENASYLVDFSVFYPEEKSREMISEIDKSLENTDADLAVVELSTFIPQSGAVSREAAYAAADGLLAVLKKHFNRYNVILVHLSAPSYCRIGNHVRAFPDIPFPNGYLRIRNDLESYFAEKMKCKVLNTTDFYFYCKRIGFKTGRDYYEPECYEDIVRCIDGLACGEKNCDARPDWKLSLQRYVMYRSGLESKPFHVFFDSNDFLDSLVLSSSAEFVTKFHDDLMALRNLDWKRRRSAIAAMESTDISDTMKEIVKAYHAAINGVYDDAELRYDLMFQNGVVPENVLSDVSQFASEKKNLLPIQINALNAGFWFAQMQGLSTEPFVTDKTTVNPVVTDVFGSCWSRTAFNIVKGDFAVNNYWFHVPPVQSRNPVIEYGPNTFVGKLNWTDRLMKKQFDHVIEDDMENSPGEWLILDFYSLISPNTYIYNNCIYSDFKGTVSKKLNAEKYPLRNRITFKKKDTELWKSFDNWLDKIKAKYGDNIILVNGRRSSYWIGDDGKIYNSGIDFTNVNKYINRMFDYARTRLNCYAITLETGYIADETSIMRKTPTHEEDRYYFDLHSIIKRITENKPAKKLYNRSSPRVWIKHLMYLSKNNSPGLIKAAINLDPIDECILSLGYNTIKRNWKTLARLYGFEKRDVAKALNKFDFGENEALKNKLLSVADKRIEPAPEQAKTDYPFYTC